MDSEHSNGKNKELAKSANPSLKERLEAFYGKPIDDICVESTPEVDTGSPVGTEYW